MVKNPPANAGRHERWGFEPWDYPLASSSGLGRSPGGGNGNLLWYACLENPMGKGVWWAMVHRVPKNRTWLSMHAIHRNLNLM